MTRLLRRRSAGERGASLVEFALIAPVLFMLLLGMITGGVAYFRQISMTDAVREGTRFGATLLPEEQNGAPQWNDWAADVRTRTAGLSGGELTTNQICVEMVQGQATLGESPEDCAIGPAPSSPDGVEATDCIVKVWAARGSKLEALLFSMDLTLRSESVARYERNQSPCN